MKHRRTKARPVAATALLIAGMALAPIAVAQQDLLGSADVELTRRSGANAGLDRYRGDRGTLILLADRRCADNAAYVERWGRLGTEAKRSGLGVMVVESHAEAFEGEDRWAFPTLLDPSGATAERFSVAGSPTALLFNGNGELVYQGAIDDAVDPTIVHRRYALEALTAMLKGQQAPLDRVPASTCPR